MDFILVDKSLIRIDLMVFEIFPGNPESVPVSNKIEQVNRVQCSSGLIYKRKTPISEQYHTTGLWYIMRNYKINI